MLSSAGYTFEHLYSLYCEWLGKIKGDEESPESIKYFVAQLAWDAIPPEMMDKVVIEEAAKGGNLSPLFKMEYGAQFQDGSDSYFNARKMENITLKLGEYPHTLIKGDPKKKYILSIDPNHSDAPTADFFAFAVGELDEKSETPILVHGYQGLGDPSNHVKYLVYLLTNFNIVMIIGDSSGLDTFISMANNSEEMQALRLNLKYLDFDTCAEGAEYAEQLALAKKQYNKESGTIVIRQPFHGEFIRRANEHLQSAIEYKKIWFASPTVPNESVIEDQLNISLPEHLFAKNKYLKSKDDKDSGHFKLTFIDKQDEIIKQTKKQCAMVEFTTTTKGSVNFDLPQHMRRINTAEKPRKDNYSALILMNWLNRVYFDINRTQEKPKAKMAVPMIIK